MIELDVLRRYGLSQEAASRAGEIHLQTGEPLGVVLSRLGLLADTNVVEALSEAYGVPPAIADDIPQVKLPTRLDEGFLRHHRILPLAQSDDELTVAMVDPGRSDLENALSFATGQAINTRVIGYNLWQEAFERLYTPSEIAPQRANEWRDEVGALQDLQLEAPAVKRIEYLVREAHRSAASDIHLERSPDGATLRFRIDGQLLDQGSVQPGMADALIARLKVLAKLDVSDHRRAQDGRMSMSVDGHPLDLRLSVIPGAHGEAAVVRLLSRNQLDLDLGRLGFSAQELQTIQTASNATKGLYLVAGPTGSGKTTTLYAVINQLRGRGLKIVTIEDPIEYHFKDVHQTQLDEKVGLTFANALRAFLRHDPDVIMVGEIRDAETAQTAVQAALTGHLVLATIHANSAVDAPIRLREMGVDPYLIEATLNATTAQRLVRRLCTSCCKPVSDKTPLQAHGIDTSSADKFHEPVGCRACFDGYRGRLVISETLAGSARASAGTSLREDGIKKARDGLTSLEEVLRVVSDHA